MDRLKKSLLARLAPACVGMFLVLMLSIYITTQMTGCSSNNGSGVKGGDKELSVEYVTVHGHTHEILVWRKNMFLYPGYSGIMHSPECPCLKGGEK